MNEKHTPIRVGDKFTDERGRVWECIESKPCGRRGFFDRAKSRFMDTYVSQVRAWNWVRL